MKASFFALFAFAAAALATPIISDRQLETQGDEIDKLMSIVTQHTANISASSPLLFPLPFFPPQPEIGFERLTSE